MTAALREGVFSSAGILSPAAGPGAACRVWEPCAGRGAIARVLAAELEAAGRRPVLLDAAGLADLKLPPGDDAALGALVRLVERSGGTPVLVLADAGAIGTPFGPGDTLTPPPDWMI